MNKIPSTSPNVAAPIPPRGRIRSWLFRALFAAECAQLNKATADSDYWRSRAMRREDEQRIGRIARFKIAGGMADLEITRRLRGAHDSPIVQAVQALLDAKIVEMTDRATNPPSAANTAELRTYESGGANAVAEFKVRLQELTAPAEEAAAKP
jgi:hypothetical protein